MATSKQASKHVHTLTHFRNAVPLVWGSLRLAPIIQIITLGTPSLASRFITSFDYKSTFKPSQLYLGNEHAVVKTLNSYCCTLQVSSILAMCT